MSAQMPWEGLDLDKLTDVQRRVFDAAYSLGYAHGLDRGLDRGRRQAEDDMAAAWIPVSRFVRRMANVPTYAELQQRRREVA